MAEEQNISKIQKTPEKPEWLIPGYPSLSSRDLVGQAAVNGQIIDYPKVVRTMNDDPISGQGFGNISFMLFKEPRKLATGKMIYGFMKNRGNWPTSEHAIKKAGDIVREQDSKYKVKVLPVGAWVPITDEDRFVKEQIDVRENEGEVHLRDEAQREKENERRRITREIREREDEAKNGGDIYDDPTSLTYYSMRRVTEVKLQEAIETQKRQIATMEEKIVEVQKELKRLEISHPNYIDEWIDRYNEERRKAGIPDYVPSDDQLESYTTNISNLELSSDSVDEEEHNNE